MWTPATQLTFSYLYLGIAQGALETARDYTRTRTRPWPSSGVATATEDPYIIRTYGEFGIDLQAADAAAREAARLLQTTWDAGDAVTQELRGELMVKVSGVKALATRVSLDITGRIFEVIFARGTHPSYGFDRFWRNVRTHTLHDPLAYKINEVGRYVLNGTYPTPSFYS
ncbi:acyl-CoA dehydrogenase family protein [Mycolicibacterium sp.]|uniref:acyl-CoA dehydrogenase family protein n=1 Tax=Mycolicibacterium sp. TaxID=2320850 RepID=UPI0037C8DA22